MSPRRLAAAVGRPSNKVADLSSLPLGLALRASFIPRRQTQRSAASRAPRIAASLPTFLSRIFRTPQPASCWPQDLQSADRQASSNAITVIAVSCGLKLTSLCLHLASTVCNQLAKDAAWVRASACALRHQLHTFSRRFAQPAQVQQHQDLQQQQQQQQAQQQQQQQEQQQQKRKQQLLAAQLLQAKSMLQQHRPDKELMRVIKTLGDSNIPLDTKWLEFTQRLASHGHDAISDSMKQLFTAAGESSQAVQALLSPEQQSRELWKSERTQSVIQQEQAFKQMVFNQLLLTN